MADIFKNRQQEQFSWPKNPDGQKKNADPSNELLLCSDKRQRATSIEQKEDEDSMNVAEMEYSSEESEDETEYIIDTRNNYYSPEQLRKNLQEKMNTPEYNAAIKSLKAKMEKEYPEKLEKKATGDNLV